ncbi:hypothetical protein WA026_010412 [Henosepilachna vigintioctopunctata]|uniref:Dolichyl-diphosphooligosaccharide--protein glycosyltransferase subunit KCP2 n=1 Tax=Henosepilachna vigintioctopunctata TaxID=420089 RepID=A0AAW1VE72_9CUCU
MTIHLNNKHRVLDLKMSVSTRASFILASISAVFIFSGMQMYKPWLTSSQFHTIFGGYLGSLFFTLCLTAVGNLETCIFGKNFQVKLFPEAIFSFLLAVFASGMIHRVCATTCLLISGCGLYYINKYSQRVYSVQNPTVVIQTSRKKRN